MAPRNHLVHHSRGQGTSFTFTSEFLVSPDNPQKLQYLREQAAVIKLFEERFTSIWENVIILAKEGKEDTKQSFQVQSILGTDLSSGKVIWSGLVDQQKVD